MYGVVRIVSTHAAYLSLFIFSGSYRSHTTTCGCGAWPSTRCNANSTPWRDARFVSRCDTSDAAELGKREWVGGVVPHGSDRAPASKTAKKASFTWLFCRCPNWFQVGANLDFMKHLMGVDLARHDTCFCLCILYTRLGDCYRQQYSSSYDGAKQIMALQRVLCPLRDMSAYQLQLIVV